MVFDIRCRPPAACFLNPALGLFDPGSDHPFSPQNFAPRFGMPVAESFLQVSEALFLKELDEAQITKAMIPVRRLADADNDGVAAFLASHGSRFLGAAAITPSQGAAAIAETEKYVTNGAFSAVNVEFCWGGEHCLPEDEACAPFFAYCEKQKIPVLFTFGGFPVPDTAFSDPIHIDRLAGKFPDLTIVLSHGAWPWVTQAVHLAFKRPNVFLAPDIYMLHVAGAREYYEAANYMLPEKILYGSAYPCVDMRASLAYYRSGLLKADVLPKVLYENAAKIFCV